MQKLAFVWLIFFSLFAFNATSQVVINEICPLNVSAIANSKGEYEDYIELYNTGFSTVNLQGYKLSDDINEPDKFTFSSVKLPVGQRIIVFASGETEFPADHYDMAVDGNSVFAYMPGSSTLDTNWRNLSFNDQFWNRGNGGIGFGDGDDYTKIDNTVSVMMRQTFTVHDTSEILKALFMMDYDDGFVAYLNGVEIAHANMPNYRDRPAWNALALVTHEAQFVSGLRPDSFFIGEQELKSILREGLNVLAVETHDYSTEPTDLSSKPYLFFGMKSSSLVYDVPPYWFVSPQEYSAADFKLKKSGETVYLFHPSGSIIDQQSYTELSKDHSYGRIPDGSLNWCYTDLPTPGMTNNISACYSGYSEAPSLFPDGGFFNSSQMVTLTSAPGSIITYTNNGDEPTANSTLYTVPFSVDSTQTIRVRVFRNGYLPGPVLTRTFFINENAHLPVLAMTTDSANLWDYNTGIYVLGPNADSAFPYYGANFWQDWTKPAGIEYFDRTKQRVLSFDADIQIYGNFSRYKPQKSFEIMLQDYYGMDELNYPLLPDKPYIKNYDRFILRNAGTDWNKVHFRDAFMQRLAKNTYCDYVAAEPVKVYLNGAQWGVYFLREKHNHKYIKTNFNIEKEDINFLEEVGSEIIVSLGSDEQYWEMYDFVTKSSATADNFFDEADKKIDLKSFTDYIIAETYYDNGDWIGDWTNNIKLWRSKSETGKWRYILIDTDFGFGLHGTYTDNNLDLLRNPIEYSHTSDIFNGLLRNQSFKRNFINRYADLINTIYLPLNVENVMKQFRDSMAFDMVDHFNIWGLDTASWNDRIEILELFTNMRPQIMRDYIQSEFNLSNQVLLTVDVSPRGAGRIEISTVVPDSLPWSGVYFHGNPVTITAIPNPGFNFDHWSSDVNITIADFNKQTTYDFSSDDRIVAHFSGSAATPLLTVSELNFHSSPEYDVKDWVELHNYGNFDLDISGWVLSDGNDHTKFVFPVSTVIPANGYLVVPEDSLIFKTLFPNVLNRTGQFNFHLGNNEDHIYLFDYKKDLLLTFEYEDYYPWPSKADGLGYTYELVDPLGDLDNGNNWFSGCYGGSPGKAYSNELSTLIDIVGSDFYCTGSETALTIKAVNEYQYQWMFNDSEIPGALSDSLFVSQTGIYNIKVNCDGCSAISSDLNVNEHIISEVHSFSNGKRCNPGAVMLFAEGDDTIYWYNSPGGKEIGKGNTFVTSYISHPITIYAHAGKACPGNEVAVTATITNEECGGEMLIFPNPASSGQVRLHDDDLEEGIATLIITDMHGSPSFRDEIKINSAGYSDLISFAFNNGVYNFTLYQNDRVYNSKILMLK